MATPLISIISPVFNLGPLLNEAIDSVINQNFKNWELILIDDCSTDGITKQIIDVRSKAEARIHPVFLTENRGAGYARNIGIDRSNGDYIAFLDSDDVWLHDKLTKQVAFLEKNGNIDFLYTWYTTINEKSEKLNLFVTPKKLNHGLLRFNNYILTSTVICRSKKVRNVKMPLLRKRQDWAYFLSLLEVTKIAVALPESLVLYRKIPGSLSANRWKLVKPNYIFFRDFLYKGNGILAALHFVVFLPFYFHNKVFNKKQLDN